jgi:hypothetical protein
MTQICWEYRFDDVKKQHLLQCRAKIQQNFAALLVKLC